MSQSDDQKTQAMEKVSDLGEQLDVGGDDLSNAFDKLKNGNLRIQQLASLGETIGRQGGAILGRQVGEAIGQKFADEDGTLSFSSIANTLRSSRTDENEAEDGEEEAKGSAGNEGASGDEESESGEEDGSEAELEGDGSGSFEDMSDEELQNLANDLMDELDQRESNES
jgi:hypothetical protein